MKPGDLILKWAMLSDLPIQGEATIEGQAVFLVLNGDSMPGEMDIAGEIAVLGGTGGGSSYFVETCAGRMIVDEFWIDENSLSSTLTSALQLLQRRVKSPLKVWALAFIDKKRWESPS